MVLKLDPRFPLVWRTPTSAQLGVDPPRVVLHDVTEAQERMLAALASGVSAPGLTMISRGRDDERDALLAVLAPVLAGSEAPTPVPTVAVSGAGELARAIASALGGSGIRTLVAADARELAGERPNLAIAAAHFVLDPELHAFWLRRDVPHLPVVVTDAAAVIGPFVEPGDGPCLRCLELHRRDDDPSWPAIAAQLLGRRSRAESAVLVAETAAAVGRCVVARLSEGAGDAASTRIDAATGERTVRRWSVHEECGCRGVDALLTPLSPARRGNGWAGAARRGRSTTRTS